MGAPITLTSNGLRRLADALDAMTEATNTLDVDLTPFDSITVRVSDQAEHIRVKWSDAESAYVVDDWIGS